jgi:hypothetical protein
MCIYDIYDTNFIGIQNCIKLCPVLKHLAIWYDLELQMPLSHQTVQWIDLWTSPDDEDQNYTTLRKSLSRETSPSLIGIRELDHALSSTTDWPSVLPPDSEVDVNGVEYRFPGVHVQHTARGILKMDMDYCGKDDDSGSFVECSESASDSDSSRFSSDMDESEHIDLDETVDDVEHNMALTIFAQTLD